MKKDRRGRERKQSVRAMALLITLLMVISLILPVGAAATGESSNGSGTTEAVSEDKKSAQEEDKKSEQKEEKDSSVSDAGKKEEKESSDTSEKSDSKEKEAKAEKQETESSEKAHSDDSAEKADDSADGMSKSDGEKKESADKAQDDSSSKGKSSDSVEKAAEEKTSDGSTSSTQNTTDGRTEADTGASTGAEAEKSGEGSSSSSAKTGQETAEAGTGASKGAEAEKSAEGSSSSSGKAGEETAKAGTGASTGAEAASSAEGSSAAKNGLDTSAEEDTTLASDVKAETGDEKLTFRTKYVTVVADKAAFDTDVRMVVRKVTDPEQLLRMVTALNGEGGSYTVKAYNVSFYDKNGKEVEPKKPVQVTVNTSVASPKKSKVVHVKDNHKTEIMDADIDRSGASFELDSFSDIGVATEGQKKIPGSSFDIYLGDELTTEYTVDDLPAGRISAEDLPEVEGYEYGNATVGDDEVEEIGTITDSEGHVYVYYTTRNGGGELKAEILGDGRIHIHLVETEQDTTYDLDADGMHVHVEAPAGAFDAGTDMEIKTVELTEEQQAQVLEEAAEKLEPGEDAELRTQAVDITFYDKDGEKVQPRKPVQVELTTPQSVEGDFCVVHLGESKGVDRVDAQLSESGNVCFAAESFSVYAVVDEGGVPEARMTVEFYNGTTKIATMYVKNSDTREELDYILYDPGAGDLQSEETFYGWIPDNAEYTTDDLSSAMTIEDVRDWAEAVDIQGTEPEPKKFYAAVTRLYHVYYKDANDENDEHITLGMVSVPVKASEYGTASVSHTVNMAYTPKDDIHNFEGWKADDASVPNITSTVPDDHIFNNGTEIAIKGDVTFIVNSVKGAWLIFDENGKGGKYNAPQFVKSGETTQRPCPDSEMTRNGYTFGGWYDTKEHADAHAADPSVTTGAFEFGDELTEKTTIYASWIPNTSAPYTVIFWTQNQDRTGYEVVGSYVNENGVVGQNIPYTVVNNGDEDYVTGAGNANGHYTGFCLVPEDAGQQVVITPEGDAVLNLHYDRIEYNFKFYLYRNGTQNNRYDYANNSGNGRSLNDLVTWHTNQTQHPSVTGYQIQSETVGGRTYYYFVMNAYYGENISSKWPTYDKITGANDREAVSYVMMVGTKLKPNPTDQGSGTVKGLITELNENILGATNDKNGNYVVIRFPNSYYNWRYHIWFETVEGEDYTGKTTHTHNGRTYYEETVLTVRSSNTTDANQNEPKYPGFDYVTRLGQNDSGTSWQGGHWTTGNNPRIYHLNYIYDRQKFKISYFDGNYVDGSGNTIQNRANQLLHESAEIQQGATISDADRNYIPDPQEAGYVFDGWYLDEGCTVPYTWATMPVEGIKVYAKWRQEEYRVFLHPNADNDPALSWGSDNVSTSFRVGYGGKVSTPTGTREGSGYEFVGWYTDPGFSASSLFNPDIVLNNDTVTTPYDKTEDTELDQYGNTEAGQEGVNKDRDENRFWITKKLDLYARWRKILEGAEGINVVYTAVDGEGRVGSNPPTDSSSYPDQSQATAQAACTAPVTDEGLQLQFKYWVLQKWDEAQNKYIDTETTLVPGDSFTVDEKLAHKEADPDNPGSSKYTIQLRAEYDEPESGLPTHIWWFENYSDDGSNRHKSFHQDGIDPAIQINEAVSIQVPEDRPGYEFLGWARVPTGTSESADGNPPTGKVLENLGPGDVYLKYEGGSFKLNDSSESSGKTVTQVAADEKDPYHDMYAVWKKKTYTVKVVKVVDPAPTTQTSFGFEDPGFNPAIEGSEYTGTFTLTHEEVKEYEEVPFKTEFKVTETPNDEYDVSVKYSVENADDPNNNVSDVKSSNGAGFTVLGDITVTVTNTRKDVPLQIDKIVENGTSEDLNRDFSFSWKAEAGGSTVKNGQFTLKHGDALKTIEVPVGSKVTVAEAATQSWPYETSSAMGSDTGTNEFVVDSVTSQMSNSVITFTNSRKLSNVTVTKKVTGNMGQTDQEFSFTAALKDGQTNLKLAVDGSAIKVDPDNGTETVTFTLKHNQNMVFENLPEGAVLTVTETQYSDYEQTYTVGTGSAQQGRAAEITVSDQDSTVTFTNKKEVIIDTGADLDFLPYVLLLGAVAAAGAALFFRRRKEV